MYLRQHRGVPLNEHPASAPGRNMPDWENVRTFVEVAQCGSFRSAACNLGQSMNALRRRINELEAQLHALAIRMLCRDYVKIEHPERIHFACDRARPEQPRPWAG